jgi:hypothetical protein
MDDRPIGLYTMDRSVGTYHLPTNRERKNLVDRWKVNIEYDGGVVKVWALHRIMGQDDFGNVWEIGRSPAQRIMYSAPGIASVPLDLIALWIAGKKAPENTSA